MKYLLALSILFLALSQVCSIKVFLIGGAANENSTLIFQQLAKIVPGRAPQPKKCDEDWSTTSCPRIAVVTSAAGSQAEGNDAYSNDSASMSYRTLLRNYGMTSRHVSVHIDNYKTDADIKTLSGKANLQILSDADVVYFNGGDQARHVRSWLNDDGTPTLLLNVLRSRADNNEVVCAGSSAGSMVWTNQTFGSGSSFGALYFKNSVGLAPKKVSDGGVNGSGLADNRNGTRSLQYEDNAGKMPAFGFLNFTTDTHFNARGRLGRLVPVLLDLKDKFGVGVDQNTSLYYDNGVGTVFGWNGVTLCDLQHAVYSQQSYFSIRNVTLHYLSEGDKFDFRTKRVLSSRPAISAPAYTNPTDSSNVLSAYEATLLETRVVDQKSLYNLGKTRTPSGYPASTPTFELKFYRGASTRGYYAGKKYTAESVLVDFSYGSSSLTAEDQ